MINIVHISERKSGSFPVEYDTHDDAVFKVVFQGLGKVHLAMDAAI